MVVFPCCKINLGLNVVERRSDGYHNIETVFYPIPLHDNLEVLSAKNATQPYLFHQTGYELEGTPDNNLVIRVLNQLREDYKQIPPLEIWLHKRIPSGAGLGGGSSDAAFMMRLDFDLAGWNLVLVKPKVTVSTRDAYAMVHPKPSEESLLLSLSRPPETWKDTVKNDFEPSVFHRYPESAAIKRTLYDMGATYAAMSGSGSSVYGLFRNHQPEAAEIFHDCFVAEMRLRLPQT